MDSRGSLNKTLDSIDLTESPVKNTNTQRHIEKINEDTSYDDDTDEISDFDKDRAKKTYRKNVNEQRKRAKITKSKKGTTTKIYTIDIDIERKKLLKQRTEKVLQIAKDRKLARANKASSDTQNTTNMDANMDNANTNAAKDEDIIDNAAKDAENVDNDAINVENTNNAPTDAGNTDNAATDGEKSDNAAISDDNTDNAVMSDYNADDVTTGDGNTENTVTVETTMVDEP